MNDTDEDTQEQMMQVAMSQLPADLTAAYREACRWAPELIEKRVQYELVFEVRNTCKSEQMDTPSAMTHHVLRPLLPP